MEIYLTVALAVTGISLAAWFWLVFRRGNFWRMDQIFRITNSVENERLKSGEAQGWPLVRIIVPARDESAVLPLTLPTLLTQDYPGPYSVILVDDQSTDGTGELAVALGREHGATRQMQVLQGEPVPPGWTGKLWALENGVRAATESSVVSTPESQAGPPEFFLFTDADISHPPESLRSLVSKAMSDGLDVVSVMAHLQVSDAWDRLLIPAFVYFFAKLYPFRWVNDRNMATAAAAGGCVLLRRDALIQAGGLEKISGEMIDDCALAGLIKRTSSNGIWLGLSHEVRSLRPNKGLGDIWATVARSAYAQLRYSPAMIPVTVAGMAWLYLVPVAGTISGLAAGTIDQESTMALWLLATGLLAWVLMAGSYLPVLKRYRLAPVLAFALPIAAVLYTLMTIDSARSSWLGKRGQWKGRTYS